MNHRSNNAGLQEDDLANPEGRNLDFGELRKRARDGQAFDPPTVLALLDEIERLRREREEIVDSVTRFALYDPDLNAWECQACRFWWEFEDGDPYEHDMRFCPRCGRRIVASGWS